MERIVVGVDGSPGSVDALRWAAEEARARHARLDVVMAWEFPLPVSGTLPTAEEMDHECQAVLDKLLTDEGLTGDADLQVQTRVVRGPAGPALLHDLGQAALLVVGSEGLGAFEGMVLGSVSLYCVSKAPCPVVVIRHDRG